MTESLFTEHQLSRSDGKFRVVVLDNGNPQGLNAPCAAVFGDPQNDCLVRIHSRCVYGEIFGSDTCDCRGQLETSIGLMQQEGAGVLIYLDQEGRGAGLLAKARGYQISQETDCDTFASYAAQGLAADLRDYRDAVVLLNRLGLRSFRLLTNNPAKLVALEDVFEVKRERLEVGVSERGRQYLDAKRRYGHLITPASELAL